jgi:hypothetical protein
MEIAEVWRYPVKSMAGERMGAADVGLGGLAHDRGVAVFDRHSRRPDHPLSSRHHPGLLGFRASFEGGEVVISGPDLIGARWGEPAVRERVSEACRREIEIACVEGGAFDDSPVHLVFLPTVAAVGQELLRRVDHRRFRANVYIAGPEFVPGTERSWVGRQFAVGGARLLATAECPRCAMTTVDPDSLEVWPALLRHLASTKDAMMGLYCQVLDPGRLEEGARLRLL